MEYEKIKQIMDEMSNSKLTSMEIEFKDGMKISMTKDNTISDPIYIPTPVVEKKEVKEEKVQDDSKVIKSPMVGTFYSKPSPTEEDFVSVNQMVNKGDTVCIIEAMKLMNEIESEYTGKIVEILVQNGQPVEYGTELFRIE